MPDFQDFINIFKPETIINYGGVYLLIFVIFAETGLFFGFFLPGDSLLFTAGLLASSGIIEMNVYLLTAFLCIAAILGNYVGYYFGKRLGLRLYDRKDSLLYKKKYLTMTEDFYNRHGGMALIFGRFLPIIRTFAPILAGVINMNLLKFSFYNVAGSILWVFSFVLGGYYLGKAFPGLKDYLEYVVVALIIITAIPVIQTVRKERSRHREKQKEDTTVS
jgi:membrane-associated protein